MPKLVRVADMQALEQAADAAGWTYADMLQTAGAEIAKYVAAHSQEHEKSIVALVGGGNNGGDTLVALAQLAQQGWQATALLLVERSADDRWLQLAAAAGVTTLAFTPKAAETQLMGCGVLLDGALGTGVRLPLRSEMAAALQHVGRVLQARRELPWRLAVDCPSGLDCDSGLVAAETLSADVTLCMAAVKQGFLTVTAYPLLGELVVLDIGIPSELPAWANLTRFVIDRAWAQSHQPARPLDAHKGTFGAALLLAGNKAYPGAALLGARAAYRAGAGLVQVATTPGVQAMLAGQLPEAIWLSLPTEAPALGNALTPAVEKANAVLLGPGLGSSEATNSLLQTALKLPLPASVIDADGLRWLAADPGRLAQLPANSLLTPHPGEMAALTGLTTQQVQADRLSLAEASAQRWGHVIVLKGAFTVVAAPDGRSAVLPLASPALARAGSGDVLAGIAVGLCAQGMPSFEAACLSVWLHGQAGLLAAARQGSAVSLLASELGEALPAVFASLAD